MNSLFQNVRSALRALSRARGFAATVVPLLAIGTGAQLVEDRRPPGDGSSGEGGCTYWTTQEYFPDRCCYETCTNHQCPGEALGVSCTQSSSQCN